MREKNIEQTIKVSRLFAGYLKGTLSDTDQDALIAWINVADQNRDLFEKVCNEQNLINAYALFNRFDEKKALAKVKARPDFNNRRRFISKKLWSRIAVAASLAFVIGIGTYFYLSQIRTGKIQHTQYVNDIKPGHNGATLTLADGKKIRLSNAAEGEIAKEAGIIVNKTADGQIVYEVRQEANEINKINTLTTTKGETYILTLPDKSKVWLNAASSLTYTLPLTEAGLRKVKLEGEAYFQIAKDKAHPFIVESRGQQVSVLGTHFNVNSYANEDVVRTTLVEGSVRVSLLNSAEGEQTGAIIKPGEQAENRKGDLKVKQVNAEDAIAWTNGKFSFDREEMGSIMRKVERWYNVQVVFKDDVSKIKLTGSLSRYENVSKLLQMLENTREVRFKLEGKTITITKL